ncbi:MAG: heat shock protein [Candidatus Scalindua rubra]|uniref:Heat shock protein n=1 Tax=Candidatus Scalindua rubra TaxID=1872076 RepID=A0A1E3XDC1_9BACT|nr:MAG: heat shock protein [Candidatus Scalindua rubra]
MTRELTKWDRLPLFSSFQDEVNRMLDSFFKSESLYDTGWSPNIDIAETERDIIIKAEIPGIDAKDIDISVTGDTLMIKGEKKEEKEHNDEYYHRIERSYGSFMRNINLPAKVVADKVKAKDRNGLLEITLPKMEKAKAKRITVKVA